MKSYLTSEAVVIQEVEVKALREEEINRPKLKE